MGASVPVENMREGADERLRVRLRKPGRRLYDAGQSPTLLLRVSPSVAARGDRRDKVCGG